MVTINKTTVLTRRAVRKILCLAAGGGRRPVFFDIDKTYPSLRTLDRNYNAIRGELLALLGEVKDMPRYHDVDSNMHGISNVQNADRNWNVFMLYAMGAKPEENRARCPSTVSTLESIPNVWQAFFSILEPGKSIPPHFGPYSGYLRYHLALRVPKENPPTLRVRDQFYTWKDGESVLFDDTWDHEVVNESDEPRAVLVVDVFRPMSRPFEALNHFVYRNFAVDYGRQVAEQASSMAR